MSATVFDVAKYILQRKKDISTMKLQKLVYYCQAWSLAWNDRPMFKEKIEAWINGPVVPELFNSHRGRYKVDAGFFKNGNIDNLEEEDKEVIEKVIEFYGNRSPQWLSDLTHMEDPWIEARQNLPPNQRGSSEITLESMQEYYSSL